MAPKTVTRRSRRERKNRGGSAVWTVHRLHIDASGRPHTSAALYSAPTWSAAHDMAAQRPDVHGPEGYALRSPTGEWDYGFERNPGHRPPPPPRPGAQRQPASVLSRVRRRIGEEGEKPFDPSRRYPRETKPHHFAVNTSYVPDEFVESAARAFFVSAWADAAEEQGESFSGMQLMDVAPPTPDEVIEHAARFIKSVEKLNGRSIDELYAEAANAPDEADHSREPTPSEFGHYLAMEAMGHGVSWYDDHPEPEAGPFVVPAVGIRVEVDPDDVDDAKVTWFELSERHARPRRNGAMRRAIPARTGRKGKY